MNAPMVKVWDVNTRRTRKVPMHADIATCGDCGRSWDDSIPTSMTPAPSGRCPFEGMRRLPRAYMIRQSQSELCAGYMAHLDREIAKGRR